VVQRRTGRRAVLQRHPPPGSPGGGGVGARLANGLCAAGLAANTVAPLFLTAATPSLLKHHVVLLEALTTSPISLVTGGALASVGRAPLFLVVLAPLCGVLLTDVFFWWAGRRWGERLVAAYTSKRPRSRRWIERADGWVVRHGVRTVAAAYFLPIPNPFLYLSCGTAGMPLLVFVIGDAIGTLLWTGLLISLGWGLGTSAVEVVDQINHYELRITIAVVIGLVVVSQVRRRRATAAAR
jgi:membrane protein DedA with SNARE-associated domain